MGETSSHACGVAMLCLIVMMLVTQARRALELRRLRQSFPELARQLGLGFEPSKYADGQGTLRGVYRGREVHVDPDDARALTVRFARSPAIELRRGASAPSHVAQPAHVARPFATRDAAFDAYWSVRRASAELGAQLAERASAAWLEVFRGRYARNIRALDVTSEGVRCEVDFGAPPHLPLAAARELLGACVCLVDRIESVPAHDMPAPPAQPEVVPSVPCASVDDAALAAAFAALAEKLGHLLGARPDATPSAARSVAAPAELVPSLRQRRGQRRGGPGAAAVHRGRRCERLRRPGPGRRARTDPALVRRPLLDS